MIRLSTKLLSAGVTLAAAALLMSGCKSTAEAPQVYRGPIIAQVNKNKGQSFFLCGQGPKPLPSVI